MYMSKFLRPSDIAKKGLIKNSLNSTSWLQNYQFILNEIAAGNLKARTYGKGTKRKSYLVSEDEVKRYLAQRG